MAGGNVYIKYLKFYKFAIKEHNSHDLFYTIALNAINNMFVKLVVITNEIMINKILHFIKYLYFC